MELQIKTALTFPEVIEFNFEELKKGIQEKAKEYEAHVYTDGQVSLAKADLAMLRKFTKALSDERIRIKKECLKPYEEFERKIKELDAIVQVPIAQIDKQVKFYEEETKAAKKKDIEEIWLRLLADEKIPKAITFDQIFNEKWLNVSVKIPAVEKEITERLQQIENDLETLSNLPEFGFEATEVYKTTLDINKAISEGKRLVEIQKRKAEAEAQAQAQADSVSEATFENAPDVSKQYPPLEKVQMEWISFRAFLSTEDALALKKFFDDRNIIFEKI